MNQLGGVGKISNMFATTADGTDCKNNIVAKNTTIYKPPVSRLGDCDCPKTDFPCFFSGSACGNTRCAFNGAFTTAFAAAVADNPELLINFFSKAACGAVIGAVVTAIVSAIEAAAPGISQLELCGGAALSDVITTGICTILTDRANKAKASGESAGDFSAKMLQAITSGLLFDEISSYLAQAIICGRIDQPCPWM